MTITFVLVLSFALISLLDVPELVRKKRKRELAVYAVLLVTAFFLFELHFLHRKVWGLNHFITKIVNFFTP